MVKLVSSLPKMMLGRQNRLSKVKVPEQILCKKLFCLTLNQAHLVYLVKLSINLASFIIFDLSGFIPWQNEP
jgi:hypothetical protein